ncbi:MAG: hypothetical protein PWP65_952 [Clostridia bacterium]|nr:hypothetical protein [Clostridia bacterium]
MTDELKQYTEAARIYAAHLEATEAARVNAEAARQALAALDPDNPALKVPLKEYALLHGNPLVLLAEIFFGGRTGRREKQEASAEVMLLAATVALHRGYDAGRVIAVLRRLLERIPAREVV